MRFISTIVSPKTKSRFHWKRKVGTIDFNLYETAKGTNGTEFKVDIFLVFAGVCEIRVEKHTRINININNFQLVSVNWRKKLHNNISSRSLFLQLEWYLLSMYIRKSLIEEFW